MSKMTSLLQKLSTKASSTPTQSKIVSGSAQNIVGLLSSKQIDESSIAAFIDPVLADPALPGGFAGREVTYGDLKTRLENCNRPNGSVGVHYPVIFSLSMAQADTIITFLKALPVKTGNSFKPKAGSGKAAAQTAESGLAAEVASLKADLSALIEVLVEERQSATPTEGHTKSATPTEPVKITGPVYRAGDVILVEIDGVAVARQISDDAKRLNKSIA